jgi:Coenzyme PQQ synthesis protein D (PqqD)
MENPRKRTTIATAAGGDGLHVFDHQQQQTYALNTTSALVWQHCDGQTTPEQLMELLRQKCNVSRAQAEQLTWLALDELGKANLLEAEVARPRPLSSKVGTGEGRVSSCNPQWGVNDIFLKGKGIYRRSY